MGKHKRKRREDDENSVDSLYRQIKRLKRSIKRNRKHKQQNGDGDISDKEKADPRPPTEEILIIDQDETEEAAVDTLLPEDNISVPCDIPVPSDISVPCELLDEVLGEDPTKSNKYGNSLHEDIASRWGHITKEGLNKDTKNEILKNIFIPENCHFLEAPGLNREIKAAVSDPVFKRDKALIAQQNTLGQATACIGMALNSLLKEGNSNIEIIKSISNAGRMLCDLFHAQSCARRSLLQFALQKDIKDIVAVSKIEKLIFGDNLGEELKAGRAINKTGAEIRYTKPPPDKTIPKPNPNLNYRGPPRRHQHQQRPAAPSAGKPYKQIRQAPQRPPQKTAPPYKHRR